MLLASIGSLLLVVSAKVQVPFWPVPMTMQTFVVLVLAIAYGPRLGTVTVALYLFEGAVGLPVFAKGGGLAYFSSPTGGYLIGFLVAAWTVGWLAERGWDRSVVTTALAMLIGEVVIFAFGLAWLGWFIANAKGLPLMAGYKAAIAAGVTPFLLAEAFKILLATVTVQLIWKRLRP